MQLMSKLDLSDVRVFIQIRLAVLVTDKLMAPALHLRNLIIIALLHVLDQ